MRLLTVLGLIALVMSSNIASAVAGKRVALIIANEAYETLPNLPTASQDAHDLAAKLGALGFEVILRKNSTHRGMGRALIEFDERLSNAEAGLVFYTGHAVQEHGTNWLIPVDAQIDRARDLSLEGIDADGLLEVMHRANVPVKIVILDACRKSPLSGEAQKLNTGLAPMNNTGEAMILYSADTDQKAVDDLATENGEAKNPALQRNSLFVRTLLGFIDKPMMSLERMTMAVRRSVAMQTQNRQKPWISFSLSRVFSFKAQREFVSRGITFRNSGRAVGNSGVEIGGGGKPTGVVVGTDGKPLSKGNDSAPMAPSAAYEPRSEEDGTAFWNSIKDSQEPYAFVSYLDHYPNGAFAPLAQAKIAQIKRLKSAEAERAMAAREREARARMEASQSQLKSSDLAKKRAAQAFAEAEKQRRARQNPEKQEASEPAVLAETTINRFPSMEVDREQVRPGEQLTVEFSLTEELITPEVTIKGSKRAAITSEGALALKLPSQPETESWTIRVVLSAPGFNLAEGDKTQLIELPKSGESDPALFVLEPKIKGIAVHDEKIRLTLWQDGKYLAKLSRHVSVLESAQVQPAITQAPSSRKMVTRSLREIPKQKAPPVDMVEATQVPDLTVHVLYDNPDKLGAGQLILASPHFRPSSRLIVERFEVQPEASSWLADNYQSIVQLGAIASRGFKPTSSTATPSQRAPSKGTAMAQMVGFGCELYRRYAPAPFKQVFSILEKDPSFDFKTIQFFSNNPILPWELMVPSERCNGQRAEFLAISHQVARWHAEGGPRRMDRPVQSHRIAEVVGIAPRYKGAEQLVYQTRELQALGTLSGFREVSGTFQGVKGLFSGAPRGIIHFAGHGTAEGERDGRPAFAVSLEDATLDVMKWRGLTGGMEGDGPFFFFNACNIGRSQVSAGFVEGWAPAVLDSGAAGFIGGLWPVFDKTAANVAEQFYQTLSSKFENNQQIPVAEILQGIRKRFYQTGDPTYLAYAFYGDVHLKMVGGK